MMKEEKTDLVVKNSAPEVMETSFLLCFAHPARIPNPEMCFFFLFPFTPWFSHPIQRSAVLSNPLSSSQLCSFLQTDTRRPKYPACVSPQFTLQRTLSDKSVWRMFMRGGSSKFLNKTSVMEPFCLHQRKNLIVWLKNLNAKKSFILSKRGSANIIVVVKEVDLKVDYFVT